jgi:hypothetical protein
MNHLHTFVSFASQGRPGVGVALNPASALLYVSGAGSDVGIFDRTTGAYAVSQPLAGRFQQASGLFFNPTASGTLFVAETVSSASTMGQISVFPLPLSGTPASTVTSAYIAQPSGVWLAVPADQNLANAKLWVTNSLH